jgi:hypothetical protein
MKRDEMAPPSKPKMSGAKLFRVLVLGGAVLAAATASFLHGDIGSPRGDSGDGGTQGW